MLICTLLNIVNYLYRFVSGQSIIGCNFIMQKLQEIYVCKQPDLLLCTIFYIKVLILLKDYGFLQLYHQCLSL